MKDTLATERKTYSPDRISTIFKMLAIVLGLFGVLRLMSGKELGVADGLFNISIAVIFFLIAQSLKSRKKSAFYFVGAEVMASLGYSYLVGRGLNIVTIVFGVIMFGWLYKLWQDGELR